MVKPKVFVSRQLAPETLTTLQEHCELEIWPHSRAPSPEELQQAVADCDGLLCMLTDRIDAALLDAAPNLRVISTCSVGFDHVDVRALSRRNIALGYTPHVLVDATADLCFALLLSAARRLPEAEKFMRQGEWTPARKWEPDLLLGRDLRGAKLGLIGLGAIGQAVAQRAAGFGMNIMGWTPSGRQVDGVQPHDLDEIIAEADFLSLHLALSEETQHFINADRLAKMKAKAILINTARGGLVDESALVAALKNQQIAGAALDVFAEEPVPADHPLLAFPNVIIAPHIGSATRGTRRQMAQLAVDNLLAGLAGRPMPHCANADDLKAV